MKWIINFLRKIIQKQVFKTGKFKHCGKNLTVMSYPYYCFNPNVTIGNNCILYPGVTFFGGGIIIIEDRVKLGNNVIINASKNGSVIIGEGTIIAANSYIIDSNHGIAIGKPICEQDVSSSNLVIGKYCWIGANSVIAKGAKLGNGVVVGANSFVNKEFSENSIIFGSPAIEKRKRK